MPLNEKIPEIEEINVDEVYPRMEYAELKDFQSLEGEIKKGPVEIRRRKQRPAVIPGYLVSSKQIAAIRQRKDT